MQYINIMALLILKKLQCKQETYVQPEFRIIIHKAKVNSILKLCPYFFFRFYYCLLKYFKISHK